MIFDPQIFTTKVILITVGILATISFSFIGGCEFKQRQWDKDKLSASEERRKLEKADAGMSHRKMEQLAEDKVLVSDAKRMIDDALKKNPKIIVGPDCVAKLDVVEPSKVNTDETLKNQDYKSFKFGADFVSLYDLSISAGNAELRRRTNGPAPEVEVTEGAKRIIGNGLTAASEIKRFQRMQERICEKQKTFNQPVSKFCNSQTE